MFELDQIQVRLDSGDAAAQWNLPRELGSASQILCCDSRSGIACWKDCDGNSREWPDPSAALDWMAKTILNHPSAARWIGYFSYDLGRKFEQIGHSAADDLKLPLFVFTFHSTDFPERPPRTPSFFASSPAAMKSNFTRPGYESAVQRVLDFISAGDVFQVNLSQRFTAPMAEPAAAIYRRLPPASFGAFLDYGLFALLSNSPELFFRVGPDRHILTRPIKGTRPLIAGMEKELRESAKDQAELNMIVDLERNDLGRVCEIGSVKVSEDRVIEAHSSVFHGVASIEGVLRDEVTFVELLRAIFPGGSVTVLRKSVPCRSSMNWNPSAAARIAVRSAIWIRPETSNSMSPSEP